MKTNGNTILITGGATGIGLALAEAFAQAGNEVIACGRRMDKLEEAKKKIPGLHIRQCDISEESGRKALFDWARSSFGNLNILVNNAGIQRMIDFRNAGPLSGEIETNFSAPVYLSAHFVPFLAKKKEAAIINISSGLGFVPIAMMPVYCATKAAIHSFSMSLRYQLKDTTVKVFEIIPPIVDTELDKGTREMRGQADWGIPPSEIAEATLDAMKKDEYERAVGMAQGLVKNQGNKEAFQRMNER